MEWVPQFSEEDFNRRMENTYRRIAGSIGHELSKDRGNTRQFKESAAQGAGQRIRLPERAAFHARGQGSSGNVVFQTGRHGGIKRKRGRDLAGVF